MNRKIIVILAALLALMACDDAREQAPANVTRENVVIDGLNDSQWTYFSFETGTVVGTSEFGNSSEDASWAARLDWDFAICGEYLKTNGGTSGNGKGGLQRDREHTFAGLEWAPLDGYLQDTERVL
ncbi:MAG: hypothetical protein IJ627_03950 [Bacteroidales bacterium]|nr:hypothetical protein [Bacteroidales bacterium]